MIKLERPDRDSLHVCRNSLIEEGTAKRWGVVYLFIYFSCAESFDLLLVCRAGSMQLWVTWRKTTGGGISMTQ